MIKKLSKKTSDNRGKKDIDHVKNYQPVVVKTDAKSISPFANIDSGNQKNEQKFGANLDQSSTTKQAPETNKTKNYSKTYWTVLGVLFLSASIFASGWAVGKGRIKLSKENGLQVNAKANVGEGSLDYKSVDEVYNALKDKYDGKIDDKKVIESIKEGVARSAGDPYTEYFNVDKAKEFGDSLNGEFTGIGAELGKQNEQIVIIAPIVGFPAEKAGLKPKDIIIEINGKSTADITINDAVKQIRGPKDTSVKLKIVRNGKPMDFEITRSQITIASVESKILDGNIGYMRISRFADDTSSLSKKAAQEFRDKGVKGVILDMRSDPGGLLNAAVDVSSLWLNQDQVVLREKRAGKVIQTYNSNGSPILNGIKTIVLIDGGSASASEITAGALKDNGVAQLVGEKSYGKGSVQTLQCLKDLNAGKCDGDLLKVTIARWYTPNDRNIDKEGIEPDFKVVPTDDDYKNQNDVQKTKAIELLK